MLHDRDLDLLLDGGVESARVARNVELRPLYVTANAPEHGDPTPNGVDAPAAADWNDRLEPSVPPARR